MIASFLCFEIFKDLYLYFLLFMLEGKKLYTGYRESQRYLGFHIDSQPRFDGSYRAVALLLI